MTDPQASRILSASQACHRHVRDALARAEELVSRASPDHATRANAVVAALRHAETTLLAAFPDVAAERALDRLLDAGTGWQHPSLVLAPPRPPYAAILAACDRRLAATAPARRGPLDAARVLVARAVRLEETARRRRRKRQRTKPEKPP